MVVPFTEMRRTGGGLMFGKQNDFSFEQVGFVLPLKHPEEDTELDIQIWRSEVKFGLQIAAANYLNHCWVNTSDIGINTSDLD